MAGARVSDRTEIRFKPTRGFETPAVSPPYLRGSNVLYDPGFEGAIRGTYGYKASDREALVGAHGYVVPFYDATCTTGMRWPDGSCSDRHTAWYQRNGTYADVDSLETTAWYISNADPRSGQFGAVWWRWQQEPSLAHPPLLAVQGFNHAPGLSARCSSADTITWSVWAKVSSITGTPKITPWVTFYNSAGGALTSSTSTSNLTTSYAQYSVVAGAPSNSYYVRVMLDWEGTGDEFTTTFVDDASLGII